MLPLIHLILASVSQQRISFIPYIWEEVTADCGSDNIISCFCLDLMRSPLFDIKQPGYKKQHHLVLDVNNCSGQNKNNATLNFCMWLVKARFIDKIISFLFLIKGHTKNHCKKFYTYSSTSASG